jgi:hypothetical protein
MSKAWGRLGKFLCASQKVRTLTLIMLHKLTQSLQNFKKYLFRHAKGKIFRILPYSEIVLQVNICQKLFFLQNTGRTCCVEKLFWVSETISVHNIFSPGLSLEFSCIELVSQWTICRHIVGWFNGWCKNKSFWQRFTFIVHDFWRGCHWSD